MIYICPSGASVALITIVQGDEHGTHGSNTLVVGADYDFSSYEAIGGLAVGAS